MSGSRPQCTVLYLQAGLWGSVHIVYVGMWCEEGLRMQRWSLREKAIIIIISLQGGGRYYLYWLCR